MDQSNLRGTFLVTPLTKRIWISQCFQWHPKCADFERNAVVCYESYGYLSPKCRDYLDDFRECLFGYRQAFRAIIMQDERQLQYKEGTRKELYCPPPPDDSY